jgi:hypothetical protein
MLRWFSFRPPWLLRGGITATRLLLLLPIRFPVATAIDQPLEGALRNLCVSTWPPSWEIAE